MRILVTGATGNLGPFVIQALRHDGHEVRALVRESSDRAWLNANRVESIEGDILQPDSLGTAVDGMAAVIHLAGLHDSWAPRAQDFFEANVDGACNVRDAARTAGVHRLVFVSSGSTIGEEEDAVGTEDTERRDYALSDYERSKVEAEAAPLEDGSPLDVVIVNPATVYGPGDASGTGQALIGALSGRLGVSVDVPVAWVYVKDVASGIASALVRGRPGERYILASHNLSRLAFLQRAVELADLDYQIKPASPLAWQAFGLIYSLPAWIKRQRPVISRAAVQIALHGSQLDGSKAERDLGLNYTPLDDGLNATLDWLHEAELVDLPEKTTMNQTTKLPSEAEVEADTRDYYRARAPEFEQWILREGRYAHGDEADAAWHREMAELQRFVGTLTDGNIFEIAAGTGWWTRLLAQRNRVVASDYAPEMLEEARRRDGAHVPFGRCRADAYRLPAGDGAWDGCMFGFWLSHVPVPRSAEFIREAARIVRPGGWIVLVDSRQAELSGASDQNTAGDRVQRQHRRLNDGREFTIWKIYWSPEELRSLLGLVCTEVEILETEHFFIGARGRVRGPGSPG